MTEVQDEDQWLYGDDKGESQKTTAAAPTNGTAGASESNELPKDAEDKDNEPPIVDKPAADPKLTEDNDAEEKENIDDNDSDSDDEPTVTIGKIVKQPDIIRPPPPPTHRTAPTSGLKDDDFTSVGKINGVAAYDYNLMELEEKPWRKPGADLSDYFNYGFNEDTWFKYCERQKALRTNESGVGLVGLGINMAKSASLAFGSSSIPVSIVNENSKYGMGSIKKYNFPPPSHGGHSDLNGTTINNSPQVNTIQVMTADRRTYSNKVLMQSGYDDMDFGGYGNQDSNYYNIPPPQNVPPFFSHPPPIHSSSWSPAVPPPGYGAPPPPMPVPPPVPFFIKEEPIDTLDLPTEKRRPKDADPERERERRRDRDRDRERDREARYRERESSSRRRSRSRSKSRHRKRSRSKSRVVRSKSKSKSRSKSRSHTPSHKHKKKKSKRERSERERSKSR